MFLKFLFRAHGNARLIYFRTHIRAPFFFYCQNIYLSRSSFDREINSQFSLGENYKLRNHTFPLQSLATVFERKSCGKTHRLRRTLAKPFTSRAANCKRECVLKARLFYLGHTKFPDRMASRTARVRKPIYKHGVDADATQACRFVDRLESHHGSFRVAELSRPRATLFLIITKRRRRMSVPLPVTSIADPEKTNWSGEDARHRPTATAILTILIYVRGRATF